MERIEQVEDFHGNASSTSLQVPLEGSPGRRTPSDRPSSPGRSSQPLRRRPRQPSIRIRRLSSASSIDQQAVIENEAGERSLGLNPAPKDDLSIPKDDGEEESWQANRRRSNSEPRRGRWSAPPAIVLSRLPQADSQHYMSPVKEETSSQFRSSMDLNIAERLSPLPPLQPLPPPDSSAEAGVSPGPNRNLLRRASGVALSALGRHRASTVSAANPTRRSMAPDEYDSRIVDFLDVIDPEVSTLSTLTNVQNSLFIPDLGSFLNRQPIYTLTRRSPDISEGETTDGTLEETKTGEPLQRQESSGEHLRAVSSISSILGEDHFAILPDGSTLEGWTAEDVEELNDHVRHMLHSRRSRFKRAMKGFGQYISKPLGFFVTLYATLITLFGLAWVLFLIGWINVGGRQLYVINVIDNVLVALFAVMGDGLAPFRAVDTYHMIFIAHYHHLTWKLRKKRTLPELQDKNDLPAQRETDVERNRDEKEEAEFSVLNPLQQMRLDHHSRKFSKSHTFYKPHETTTHSAFPLRLLVAIVVLLDFHSIFQIALGTCTWSISYHVRPFALTTVILCCSLACNITGGILIMVGDRMTRKKEVVKRMFRQQLTSEAMKKIEKRRRKEEERKSVDLERLNAPRPYNGT